MAGETIEYKVFKMQDNGPTHMAKIVDGDPVSFIPIIAVRTEDGTPVKHGTLPIHTIRGLVNDGRLADNVVAIFIDRLDETKEEIEAAIQSDTKVQKSDIPAKVDKTLQLGEAVKQIILKKEDLTLSGDKETFLPFLYELCAEFANKTEDVIEEE